MKLVIMLLADYANITLDNKLNVIGIFNNVNATAFPARHPSMFLVMQLSPELGEVDQEKELTVRLVDTDHKAIYTITLPVKIERNNQGERPGTNVILQLNDVVFPKDGTYAFVAEMDSAPLGEDVTVTASRI